MKRVAAQKPRRASHGEDFGITEFRAAFAARVISTLGQVIASSEMLRPLDNHRPTIRTSIVPSRLVRVIVSVEPSLPRNTSSPSD